MRQRSIIPCRDLGEAWLKTVRFDSFTVFQGLLLLVSREVSDNATFRERVLSGVLVSRPEQPQFFCDGVVGHFFAGRFRPKPPAKLLENHFPNFQR